MNVMRMFGLVLAAASFSAQAQALQDPMRPPQAQPAAVSAEAAPAASGGLQSILIAGPRRVAVINGQTVAVGERVGDATLVRVAETEVTLRRGDEFETLKLHPGVDKKLSAPRAPKGGSK